MMKISRHFGPILVLICFSSAFCKAADNELPNLPTWVRATSAGLDKARQTTRWYSPKRQIWVEAIDHGPVNFYDAVHHVRQIISVNRERVYTCSLGEETPGPAFPDSQLTAD